MPRQLRAEISRLETFKEELRHADPAEVVFGYGSAPHALHCVEREIGEIRNQIERLEQPGQ